MAIHKATLAKKVDGVVEYIYPKTTSDIVEYTDGVSVYDKLSEIQEMIDSGEIGGDISVTAKDVTYGEYDYETVYDALDALLYVAISITSFSNNVGTVELGTTVDSITFTWATNKTPYTLTLAGSSIDTSLTSTTLSSLALKLSSAGSKSYTLVATDDRSASSSKTTYVYFYNGIYYGVGTVTESSGVTDSFIQGLTKSLTNSKAKTFTVTAGTGQYIYYAIPSRLGTPTFTVGGFEGGFDVLATVTYTNASGFSETYNVYKSTNANLGSTTVVAS